jgi:hypothetical protein
MAKDRALNVRIDAQTEERLTSLVRILGARGPEPSISQVIRYAIDRLWEHEAGGSGPRDEGSDA